MSIQEQNRGSVTSPDSEAVKLVIWDLDETFWRGTLSEGGIEGIADNIELIKILSARGIINSICSKNDFAQAREQLERLGVWEYFIFPRIAFAPKGEMIKDIIETAQLRAPSVLFVDDNLMNLYEAVHYNEGLQIAGPHILPGLLAEPRCTGKTDPGLERLAHYKVLEKKQADQTAAGSDNTAFLRSSGIRVSIHHDVMAQFPRIHDLVNRTNQLNFTKRRWPEDEGQARLAAQEELGVSFNSHWGYVKVADRYGNYGICGFFMLRNHSAVHYLFSCRAMNMGVEQFIWQRLGRPFVQVTGDVSATLGSSPDWITMVEDADDTAGGEAQSRIARPRLCVRGACDMSMVAHYLRTSHEVIEEFQYPFEGWAFLRVAREIALSEEARRPEVQALLERTPGMSPQRLQSAVIDGTADVYLLSFSVEIFGRFHRARSTGTVVPLYLNDTNIKSFADMSYDQVVSANPQLKITPAQWAFLQDEYEPAPYLDIDLLTADLHLLFGKLKGKKVVVLKLNTKVGAGKWQLQQFERINAAVLPVAQAHGCTIVDIGDFVRSAADLAGPNDPGVHYSREVYQRLAAHLQSLLGPAPRHAAGAAAGEGGQAQGMSAHAASAAMSAAVVVPPVAQRHLISLGFRCDVAFQLRMHGRENVAHFFDWLATPMDGVIKIIDADFDVFYPDHLALKTDTPVHCVEDKMTGTVFHHQFPLHAGHMQPDFLLYYQTFIGKFRHLAARFRQYMATRSVTLVRQFITRDEALRLEETVLRRFPGADVAFLYLVPPGREFETPLGRARSLKHDGSSLGDPAEWVRVLREERLIDAPYRHATVEILGAAHDDHNLATDNRFTESQLRAALAENPCSVSFLLELARFYEVRNMWARCEELALSALACAPDHQEALFKATLAQWRLSKVTAAKAADIFEGLITAKAPQPAWLREAAAACFAAGRGDDALRHINQAIQADPVDQRNYLAKVNYLYHAKRMDETGLALDTAMRLGNIPLHLQHILAKSMAWRGQLRAAMDVEIALLAHMPKSVPSLFHLALLAERTGDVSEALRCFEAAMPFPPGHEGILQQVMATMMNLAPVARGVAV